MKSLIVLLFCALIIPASAQTAKQQVKAQQKDSVKVDSTQADTVSLAAGSVISGTDSVNLSQLVQAQIEAARQKEIDNQNKPPVQVEEKKAETPVKPESNFWVDLRKNIPLSNDELMKAVILIAFSIMAFSMVFFKRMRSKGKKGAKKTSEKKSSNTNKLKKNIEIIRQEKPLKVKYPGKLKSVRSKLSNKTSINLTNEAVTKAARELQISKGEILLAARIKSHEIMNGCTSKN